MYIYIQTVIKSINTFLFILLASTLTITSYSHAIIKVGLDLQQINRTQQIAIERQSTLTPRIIGQNMSEAAGQSFHLHIYDRKWVLENLDTAIDKLYDLRYRTMQLSERAESILHEKEDFLENNARLRTQLEDNMNALEEIHSSLTISIEGDVNTLFINDKLFITEFIEEGAPDKLLSIMTAKYTPDIQNTILSDITATDSDNLFAIREHEQGAIVGSEQYTINNFIKHFQGDPRVKYFEVTPMTDQHLVALRSSGFISCPQ